MLCEKTVINDCYILQSLVGEDSYSEHWKATAIFSPTRCLLRFIKKSAAVDARLESLRAEAYQAYLVRGFHIADFIETEIFDERFFISSEFSGGRALSDIAVYGTAQDLGNVCADIECLARDLHLFHQHKIIYGNLTAENLTAAGPVGVSGRLKICKPSLLCLFPTLDPTPDILEKNHSYLSPEVKTGAVLTPASDIYSLGIHFVRFITGRSPWPADSPQLKSGSLPFGQLEKTLTGRNVPGRLIAIILKCLRSDPADRYQSCMELLEDLELYRLAGTSPVGIGSGDSTVAPVLNYSRLPEQVLSNADIRSIDSLAYFRSLEENSAAPPTPAPKAAPVVSSRVFSYLRESVPELPSAGKSAPSPSPVARTGFPPDTPRDTPRDTLPDNRLNPVIAVPPLTVMPALVPDPVVNQILVSGSPIHTERSWSHVRVRLEDVYSIVRRSAQHAKKGKGSFRFIQEPESGYSNPELFTLLTKLSTDFLFVNAGSCARFGSADIRDFLKMVRKGLSASIAKDSKQSRTAMARRVALWDKPGFFRQAPLGRQLYGTNAAEIADAVYKTVSFPEIAVRSLCAFGTKTRPLVLLIRGGERIHRNLHELFLTLAREAEQNPVCVIVFFEHIRFESWHALSHLTERDS